MDKQCCTALENALSNSEYNAKIEAQVQDTDLYVNIIFVCLVCSLRTKRFSHSSTGCFYFLNYWVITHSL